MQVVRPVFLSFILFNPFTSPIFSTSHIHPVSGLFSPSLCLPSGAHHHQFLSGLLQIPSKVAFLLSLPPLPLHSMAGSYCVLGCPASDPLWPSCVLRRKFRILFVSVTSTVAELFPVEIHMLKPLPSEAQNKTAGLSRGEIR